MDFAAATNPPPALFLADGDGQARGQMEMELEGLMDEKAGSAGRGTYTAQRFKEKDGHRYGLIVSGLAQGYPKQQIAKAVGVAWETVRAVERAEMAGSLREEKKGFADGLADVIERGIDGLKVKAAAGKLSALDVAVLIDKHQLLRGEATSIIETRGEDPAVAAYLEHVRQMGLRAADEFTKGGAVRPVAGVVVEMEPESGAGGVKPPAQAMESVED